MISTGHMVLILIIVLIIFGPRRLPELGKTLGKGIKNFKDSFSGIDEVDYRHTDQQRHSREERHPSLQDPNANREAPLRSEPRREESQAQTQAPAHSDQDPNKKS